MPAFGGLGVSSETEWFPTTGTDRDAFLIKSMFFIVKSFLSLSDLLVTLNTPLQLTNTPDFLETRVTLFLALSRF